MADYYIKKVADDDVHLYLQCSVSGNSSLTVIGLSLFSDAACTTPVSPSPTIAASDAFHTSQGSCNIHLQPTSSGGWTFQARKKSASNLYNPLVVTGSASTPASFSVVATATGFSDLVLDNRVPSGDGILHIDGNLTGAVSTISGVFLVNLIASEGMKIAAKAGIKLPIYFSQNIDGFSNEELYARYEGRVKHL